MIRKPEGYDAAQAYTGEGYPALPAGLYVCEIKQVNLTETPNQHLPQIAVLFDIAEGEQKGYYSNRYQTEKATSQHPKWKGVYRQSMTGPSLPFFKGLITSIERSTPGFSFPFDRENNEKTLVGKRFGAVMGRRQFETQSGNKAFVTEIKQVRSIEGLKTATVPEDELLDTVTGGTVTTAVQADPIKDPDGFMHIPDGIQEELPFM